MFCSCRQAYCADKKPVATDSTADIQARNGVTTVSGYEWVL
ncbi:hypothetical protein D088_750014 [Salmonella enterica subsp. houtenae serovar 16:z4,z32:-- str. RKS3027]|nr:hypothetical protein D088_750014 [Salmonella enterica subsp. houtenae serovar 16:z4,z32:-- str. RKS3027]